MFFALESRQSLIRRLPYPYEGAVALSSDAEYCTIEFLDELMAFLNSRRSTRFGAGLGLEVTSSFFCFSVNPHSATFFSSSAPDSAPGPAAARLGELLKTGWLDCIHGYGDFDAEGGFTRQHAEACFGLLDDLSVKVRVFTNHGDANNVQNVGRDAEYHRGDRPGDAAYHADLMARHRVEYVWTDSLYLEPAPARRTFWRREREEIQPLFRDVTLQDGSGMAGFMRARGTGPMAPNLSSFGRQVRLIDFDRLYREQGVSVLYQHLGVLHKDSAGLAPATVEAVARSPQKYLAPFYVLQRESQEGRLWVAGLSRLLTYADAVRKVDLRVDEAARVVDIIPDQSWEDPRERLQGLTLYLDPRQGYRLRCGEVEIRTEPNGPDRTGRYSIAVPMTSLPDAWS